eukprot:XP_028345264.1 uncharacterized protein LOC114486240 [Physeter catodon]
MAPLSAGMTTTSTPTGRSTTAAARFSVLEIRSAGALGLYTTVTMKPNCPNGRGSAGWDTATQRLRCSDRKKQKELRGMASDTKKRFLFSVVHTGEAGSEHPVRCGASRGRRFRRPVLQTDSGETSPEGKRGGGDLGCSVETAGTKGTCISDFGGLKCIPVALGVAPLQQKEQSVSEKAESGSVEGRCEDFSSATPQNAETDSPLCTTAAEVPLSGGKLLSVHAPDEGSYAAVLQQKIRAESAGWVADSDLVNCLTDFLLLFKTVVDLPWAFALPLLGAAVRLTTLPFAISSERDIRLRAVYQEEMTALQRAAEKAKSNGMSTAPISHIDALLFIPCAASTVRHFDIDWKGILHLIHQDVAALAERPAAGTEKEREKKKQESAAPQSKANAVVSGESVNTSNTLWLNFLVCKEADNSTLQCIVEAIFASAFELQHILMFKRTALVLSNLSPLFELLEPLATLPLERQGTTPQGERTLPPIYHCRRTALERPLQIRVAAVEDYDDVVKIFDEQTELRSQDYGEFFLAELIGGKP